jgi:hypothetical protein
MLDFFSSSFRDAPLGAGPESIPAIVSMDSGFVLRTPRNDSGYGQMPRAASYGGPANWRCMASERCGGDPSVAQIAAAISRAVKTDLAAINFPCMAFDQAER